MMALYLKGKQRLGIVMGLVIGGFAINGLLWWNSQPIGFSDGPKTHDLTTPELVSQVKPSIVKVLSGPSLGTGFAVDATTVLTNAHVIKDRGNITLVGYQGKQVKAKLIGLNAPKDVAVLEIAEGSFPPVKLGNSKETQVGQAVVAIGMPMGQDFSVTSGIISAKDRKLDNIEIAPDSTFLQTDAAINPGNSGGPLFNSSGEVIGINSRILLTAQGIGYSIPIEDAMQVAEQIKAEAKGGKP